jgi:16S rRNA (cytosine1402-N4)-methyltransferase
MKKQKQNLHSPVLLDEVLDVLKPMKGESYLDLTSGYGGHSSALLERTGNYKQAVLCDRDPEAITYLSEHFTGKGITFIQKTFSDACNDLASTERRFDMILADLGVSSPHLDKANRGFSVLQSGPLDMRMDQSSGRTAADIVNSASEKEIETILRTYGEEPKARKIAHAIMLNRPFSTTTELAECIKRVYGGYTKHHPAVRSFQALRIAVNDELALLMDMLPKAIKLLAPGGRLGVITFHSLEDRIVKQFFADLGDMGYEAEIAILTKKPVTPTQNEISFNPRARSAKLRAVVKK